MAEKQFQNFPKELQVKIFNLTTTINKQFQDFPKDVQYNILERLPLKFLVRFMCTSKAIQSIITSPSFMYLCNTNLRTGYHIYSCCASHEKHNFYLFKDMLFVSSSKENLIMYKEFTNVPVGGYHCVIGSCHGLVCFANVLHHHEEPTLVIWNPFLGKSITIFINNRVNQQSSDPLGFGYDSSSLDFNVIRIGIFLYDNTRVWVEIYALHSHTWKTVHGSLSNPGSKIKDHGIFLNGVMHWILENYPTPKTITGQREYIIVTYNIEKEVFGEINMPNKYMGKSVVLTKLVRKGEEKLAMYHNERLFRLWVMEEYGVYNSWKKIFSLDLGGKYGKVLNTLANGKIVISTNYGSSVLYNPYKKTVEKINNEFGMLNYVGHYVESVVFPKQQNSLREE